MKRKKAKETNGKTIKMVVLFVFFVLLLVGISLSIRLAVLFSKSTFDGQHRYNLAFITDQKKEVTIVSIAPESQSASHVVVHLVNPTAIGNYLEIPIDGVVYSPAKLLVESSNPSDTLLNLLFHYPQVQSPKVTALDLFRLWVSLKSLPAHAITKKDMAGNLDDSVVDKISAGLFADSAISSENISVEIVNATDTIGLGNRLARQLTNMGGNVVSLSTSDKQIPVSSISHYSKGSSYTLKKLQQILSLDPSGVIDLTSGGKTKLGQKSTLSDIIVVIGEDRKETKSF